MPRCLPMVLQLMASYPGEVTSQIENRIKIGNIFSLWTEILEGVVCTLKAHSCQ